MSEPLPPASPARDVERTRAGFEAFARGDFATMLELFSEDVETYAPPELANAGTFHGKDELVAWLRRWLEPWERYDFDVTRIESTGERHVIAMAHQTAVGKGSGIQVEMDVAFLLDVRREGVVAMQLYPDWDEAVAAAARREAED